MRPTAPPEGYRKDLEGWVDLPDGSSIFVRPIVPDDIERLAYAFAHADIETLRRRFFTGAPPADRPHLEYLAIVDYRSRLALIAMDEDGTGIGIGRYEGLEDGAAEVAIVVAPEWRRRGVATALLLGLEHAAASQGFSRLVALYLPENGAVEALLRSIGYGSRAVTDGIAVLTKDLP
jgi:RimJ/RimL family protein N-acetyltransferase